MPMDEGRFPPGTVIGQRYRVVSLLGRGGMGEVYRANDLLVGQTVALKFLPDAWAKDESVVTRFRNEVRVARMVSHPNVCRVHDLGEADGRIFLSMEFIDGEDLATLLRRIGKLGEDKALEIAHKLCAGLHAAHAKGVIHRDLKPANIMIDGRGEVLITDFGLAGVAGTIRDAGSGTPLYMSPEQKSGTGVSERSDLYSLGLVLFELFTGHRYTPGETAGLRPEIGSVIGRCLREVPAERPETPIAVSRALPGGDPLAMAMRAGETPKPEVVAAAGDRKGLRRPVALALAAVAIGGFFLHAMLWERAQMPTLPPEELRVRARDVLRGLERGRELRNEVYGLTFDEEQFALWKSRMAGKALLIPHRFWYRTSPVPLGTRRVTNSSVISRENPPLDLPGMRLVELDMQGRLVRVEWVRDAREPAGAMPPDWMRLLALTGAQEGRLREASSAGDGFGWNYRDEAGIEYWIDGLVERGNLRRYWVRVPTKPKAPPGPAAWLFGCGLAGLALIFAIRNLRLGRVDGRGATVLTLTLFAASALRSVLMGSDLFHWNANITPLDSLMGSLTFSGVLGLGYLAAEPLVRRRWPQVLVTWTGLLRGDWRNPAVGKDILAGMAVAVLTVSMLTSFGPPEGLAAVVRMERVESVRWYLASILGSISGALFRAILNTFFLFLLRLVLRVDWAAGVGATLLLAGVLFAEISGRSALAAGLILIVGVAQVGLLIRFGFFAKVACEVAVIALLSVQTLDPEVWYAVYSYLTIGWLVGLSGLGYWIATQNGAGGTGAVSEWAGDQK
jgi:serine/threonine-protein kinase